VPTVAIGASYTPQLFIPNTDGSPATSGVTGTITTYGPDSATAPIDTGALSHLGNGVYGRALAGTLLTVAGLYRWAVTALTAPTQASAAGWFVVGYPSPNQLTLREILAKLAIWLGGYVGRTTAPGTNTPGSNTTTLIDTARLQLGQANAFAGADVLLLKPVAETDPNPLFVTASDPATGTLTMKPSLSALIPQSTDYLFLRRPSVQRLVEAVRQVLAEARVTCDVTDAVALTGIADTYEYACPAPLCRVTGVEYRTSGAPTTDWAELGAQYVEGTIRDRRLLKLRPPFDLTSAAVRVRGRAWAPLPELPAYGASGVLNAAVDADGAWVVDAAKARLQLDSRDPAVQRQGAAAWQLALSRAPGQGPLTGWPVG
jgi:hypothetical protein